jgi:signal transduction histidine kinase
VPAGIAATAAPAASQQDALALIAALRRELVQAIAGALRGPLARIADSADSAADRAEAGADRTQILRDLKAIGNEAKRLSGLVDGIMAAAD